MVYDITDRVHELWDYYDKLLDERLAIISEKAEVPRESLIKLNPADFIERSQFQKITGYQYQKVQDFIKANKRDDTFLISPLDAIEETAAQISYKSGTHIERTIRASKCHILPIPKEFGLDFFIKNHRQTPPNWRNTAVALGLEYQNEIVAVMMYDISAGGIRGAKTNYELVRLSICKDTMVHGGASKLQKACEEVMAQMECYEIYSYSNATINNGAVYKNLGFTGTDVEGGQPFVMMEDNSIERLISLYPESTDEKLAYRGRIKTHIGGNKTWWKKIPPKEEKDD